MLRDGHADQIKTIPAVASAVAQVELALAAPRDKEVGNNTHMWLWSLWRRI